MQKTDKKYKNSYLYPLNRRDRGKIKLIFSCFVPYSVSCDLSAISVGTGTSRHRSAPVGTSRHRSTPVATGTDRHRPAPTGTDRHSADRDRHRPAQDSPRRVLLN